MAQWENSLVNGWLNCIMLRPLVGSWLWDLWVALGHWALGWFLNSSMMFLDPQAEVRPRRLQGTWFHVLWAQGLVRHSEPQKAVTQWALTVITLLYGYIMYIMSPFSIQSLVYSFSDLCFARLLPEIGTYTPASHGNPHWSTSSVGFKGETSLDTWHLRVPWINVCEVLSPSVGVKMPSMKTLVHSTNPEQYWMTLK